MEGHLSYFDFLFGISCEPSVLCTDITRHIILLYQSFSESVSQPFPPNHKPDELGAEILRECSLPTTCHMSHVACHMSHVMCHVSCVMCHMSPFFFLFFGQSGKAYWSRVCYQRGLPRLVFTLFH